MTKTTWCLTSQRWDIFRRDCVVPSCVQYLSELTTLQASAGIHCWEHPRLEALAGCFQFFKSPSWGQVQKQYYPLPQTKVERGGFQGLLSSNSTWMTKICSSNLPFTGRAEKGSQSVVPRKYGCTFQKLPPTWLELFKPFFSSELTRGWLWKEPCTVLYASQTAACSACSLWFLWNLWWLLAASHLPIFYTIFLPLCFQHGAKQGSERVLLSSPLFQLELTTSNRWTMSRNGSFLPPVNKNSKVNAFNLNPLRRNIFMES